MRTCAPWRSMESPVHHSHAPRFARRRLTRNSRARSSHISFAKIGNPWTFPRASCRILPPNTSRRGCCTESENLPFFTERALTCTHSPPRLNKRLFLPTLRDLRCPVFSLWPGWRDRSSPFFLPCTPRRGERACSSRKQRLRSNCCCCCCC